MKSKENEMNWVKEMVWDDGIERYLIWSVFQRGVHVLEIFENLYYVEAESIEAAYIKSINLSESYCETANRLYPSKEERLVFLGCREVIIVHERFQDGNEIACRVLDEETKSSIESQLLSMSDIKESQSS